MKTASYTLNEIVPNDCVDDVLCHVDWLSVADEGIFQHEFAGEGKTEISVGEG